MAIRDVISKRKDFALTAVMAALALERINLKAECEADPKIKRFLQRFARNMIQSKGMHPFSYGESLQ